QLQFLSQDRLSPALADAELPHLGANHIQSELHFGPTLPAKADLNYSHMRMKCLDLFLALPSLFSMLLSESEFTAALEGGETNIEPAGRFRVGKYYRNL